MDNSAANGRSRPLPQLRAIVWTLLELPLRAPGRADGGPLRLFRTSKARYGASKARPRYGGPLVGGTAPASLTNDSRALFLKFIGVGPIWAHDLRAASPKGCRSGPQGSLHPT